MDFEGIRKRMPKQEEKSGSLQDEHPAGPVQHGLVMQILRILTLNIYFFVSCIW